MNFRRTLFVCTANLILLTFVAGNGLTYTQTGSQPNPVLVFNGSETFKRGGKDFTRYNYFVENSADFPNELFAAAPSLPPCGTNSKASRTWVDFYDSTGKRLHGFCALTKSSDLNKIWFALEPDAVPPSYVYIELTDRQTNTKYKSNLADTTQ
jgi:hypothetical protein